MMSAVAMTFGAPAPSAAMPLGRLLRAYVSEAKYDALHALRTPGFSIPFLVLPSVVYLLFGVVMFDPETSFEGRIGLENYLFSGFSVFAVLMPGIFIGCLLAVEREGGLLKLKRALPAPFAAVIVAKVVTAMLFAAAGAGTVVAIALLADTVTLSAARMLAMWAVLVLGAVPFCAIGLLIGAIASGSSAPAYGNLVFLPMMWLSGLFIPLPEFLRSWVAIWPAFHLNQVVLAVGGVSDFVFLPAQQALAVLAGVTVLFGGLAVYRLARFG